MLIKLLSEYSFLSLIAFIFVFAIVYFACLLGFKIKIEVLKSIYLFLMIDVYFIT